MITMPRAQKNHNFISAEIMPWINLHFPADSAYKGRIFIGQRKRDTNGIYNLSRRSINELAQFVPAMHISNRLDYYIMANTVSGVERNTDEVFSLNNIVIDIDCHSENSEMSSSELTQAFIWRCQRDLWSKDEMPKPNSVVYTGRGVQLWWAINPISIKLEWIYRRVHNWLMDKLQELLDEYSTSLQGISIDRAASQKLAGWFRLPLTYNTVAQRWGSLQIMKEERYSHQELYDMVPEGYKTAVSDRKNKTNKQVYHTHYNLTEGDIEALKDGSTSMALRVYKIAKLRAFRNAAAGAEMRDLFCFVIYNALLSDYDEEEAWERLQAFNAGFKVPLTERELQNNMLSATRKYGYKLTNQWIIDSLSMTEEEQEYAGIHPVTDKFISFKKSNFARDSIRASLKEDRNNKIIDLYSEGVSKAEISRILGLSRNTVTKVINDYNELIQADIEPVDAELQKAAGAENIAVSAENKVLKNGAFMYVSYAGDWCKEQPVTESQSPYEKLPVGLYDPGDGG